MSLGSSKPWREVLARIIGPGADLNADAILEYFEPVYRWVKEQNDKNGVHRGWYTSQKKVAANR